MQQYLYNNTNFEDGLLAFFSTAAFKFEKFEKISSI